MKPPIAKKDAYKYIVHGNELLDNYHWLRDQKWPQVEKKEILDYLKSENDYTKQFFSPYAENEEKIYKELIGRIKLADQSTPIKNRNYYYFYRTEEKSQYGVHLRKDKLGKEEIILDEEKEAKGHSYFNVGAMSINPQENLMAYSVDTNGDEHYVLYVKDLKDGRIFSDKLTNVIGSVVWDEYGKGFYYTKVDSKWRPNRLYYHILGEDQQNDKLIYQEKDTTFRISIGKSSDYSLIFVNISSSNSSEIRFIKSHDLNNTMETLIKRREDHLCSADYFKNQFYIHTNDKGKNFRLVRVNRDNIDISNYQELISHSDDVYLVDYSLYDNKLVVETKEKGLPQIHIMDYDLKNKDTIKYPDPSYTASVVYSCHDDEGIIITYSSLKSPRTTLKYKFSNKELVTLRTQEIPSGYNAEEYQIERIFAKSKEDGVKIPVSLVYKKNLFTNNSNNPLFLYGYGSYGIPMNPGFNSNIISLLDRGFVYAIAHIRGGTDLGFNWYESAKFLNKKRTFNDFIDVTNHLIDKKYTRKGNVAIAGGSAGGMLVGNVINQSPELFKLAIADVPFVDVLNTMLDETLPLTPGEFKEWGNPKEKEFFDYIKSYSPYDNVKSQHYPHLYVLAGLNDPRVTYWEPAKWVAKLRDMKQDNNILILDTNMDTGHGGKSGRFDAYKEVAKKYLFILKVFDRIE